MDAARRQAYLSTLGIDIWVSRAALAETQPHLIESEPEEAYAPPPDEYDVASYEEYVEGPSARDVRPSRSNPIPPAPAVAPRSEQPAAPVQT
ncbi:MAG TPA: hypothetical protein VFM46_01330, partial [Pseudomonadales bacterium]|nr:hypothetical protein [Pseudomonadales bacterium]